MKAVVRCCMIYTYEIEVPENASERALLDEAYRKDPCVLKAEQSARLRSNYIEEITTAGDDDEDILLYEP